MPNWKRSAQWMPGLLFWLGIALLSQDAAAQSGPGLTLLRADARGLELLWETPAYGIEPVEIEGQTFSRVTVAGLPAINAPGQPELPLLARLIGLPPTGGAVLRLTGVETELVPLPHPPLPAPAVQAVPARQPGLMPPLGRESRPAPNPALAGLNGLYPPHLAELGPVQQLRQQRVARLLIHPLRVNPAAGTLEVTRRLRLEIRFDEPAADLLAATATATGGPFERLLTGSLLNPDAVNWPAPLPPAAAAALATGGQAQVMPLKIRVDARQPGLVSISYQQLQQAGWPVDSLDPRLLQLTTGWPRQELALWLPGEADGRLNPGDQLFFYAEPAFSRYTTESGYFLSAGTEPGRRMASRSASAAGLPAGTAWRTATAESSHYYDSLYPDHRGDYWYWFELHRDKSPSGTFALPLTAPLTSASAATLTVHLRGFTDPLPAKTNNHRVAVKVNGVSVGEVSWDGKLAVSPGFAVPAGLLKQGSNQVSLSLPGISGVTVEGAWLDALSLRYATGSGGSGQLRFEGEATASGYTLGGWPAGGIALFDVTSPLSPTRLTGFALSGGSSQTLAAGDTGAVPARYLAVPDGQAIAPLAIEQALSLPEPPGGADVIIITHPNFSGAAARLAAHRQAQGLRVATANVLAIYDAFGSGVIEPEAIKHFLQHAYASWPEPRPAFVVLLGDGSLDFKGYSVFKPVNYIPPYMAPVDPIWGDTAADNQYVTLAGSDDLPEMFIGRLPVNSAAEAETVVSKIIGYESDTFPGGWNARHLFVADNPDLAGNFHTESDAGYNSLTEPFLGERLYFTTAAASEPYFYTDVAALRYNFFNQFNRGAAIVTFNGHSSWLNWAMEGIFNYYWEGNATANDLLSLRNQTRLPLVLGMTCFTSSFHRPEPGTLDEALVRLPGGGAIATWGSTGLGISTGHGALQAGFYEAINGGQRNLGAVTQAGLLKLYATGLHQDLLNTFVLLGDPTLNLNFEIVPFTHFVYLPIVQKKN